MRRLLTWIVLLVGLVIGALIILPSVLSVESYRGQVETAASNALGREVNLSGDISLSLFPRAEVRASEVSIANVDGFGDQPFAEMGEMRVAVQLLPLLSRNVVIDEFVLVDPVIRLRQRGAANNWTFQQEGAEPAPAAATAADGFRRPGALPFETAFGDVRIENGTVIYRDDAGGRRIDGLNLNVDLPPLDAPVRLDGSLVADGEAMRFDAGLGSLRDFFEGRETPLDFTLGGDLVRADFDGLIAESADLVFNGDIDATIPSLRRLAAFAGSEVPEGEGLGRFAINGGRLTGRPGALAFNSQDVRLDDIRAAADLAVAYGAGKPSISGTMAMANALDLDAFLPPAAPSAQSGGVAPWSTEAIDLSALDLFNADIGVTAPTLRLAGLEMSDIAMQVGVRNRRMEAVLSSIQLYGATGTARLVANGRGDGSWRVEADLDGLDALPFLRDAANFERLEGIGDFNLNVNSVGLSQDSIMRNLRGGGRFGFADGAIRGVNLASLIRELQGRMNSGQSLGIADALRVAQLAQQFSSGVTPENTGAFDENQQTDFSSLTGSFDIAGGQVSNLDLSMLSPLLRVAGRGTVDLPGQSFDYLLRPRAVASVEGQGGQFDLQGITVPVRFSGDFNNPRIGIDAGSVFEAAVQSALGGALGGNNGQGQRSTRPEDLLLDAIIGGGQDRGGDQQEEEEPTDPAELLLRGLLQQATQGDEEEEEDPPQR
jgi:AsmA protein